MTTKFLPTVLHGQDWTYIRLSGVIDEDNRLTDLLSQIQGSRLFIDLVDIERINSCGVRDWVNWLDAATRERQDTLLIDCSPAIVAQLNLVGNFAASAGVLSIVAPYYCESCDLERTTLLTVADLEAPDPRAPSLACEACAQPMAFDDIEESYFAFLSDTRVVANRPDLDVMLSAARDVLGEPAGPLTTAERPVLPPKKPKPAPPRSASPPHTPMRTEIVEREDDEGGLSGTDMIFYVAVGVLSAILIMVVYKIAVP